MIKSQLTPKVKKKKKKLKYKPMDRGVIVTPFVKENVLYVPT